MNSLFDVKSARLDVLSLQLRNDDFGQLETALEQRLKQLGDFASMPFVLDLEQISNAPDLPVDKLVRMFRRHGLQLVGLRHQDETVAQLAAKHGLAFSVLPERIADTQIRATAAQMAPVMAAPVAAVVTTPAAEVEAESGLLSDRLAKEANITSFYDKPKLAEPITDNPAKPTVVIRQPIRTGQQVYAENADLIVLSMVSVGAEIIADGNIHVYAPLRGRALAGASGNKKARIFVQHMQAELVSVAGIYRVFDQNLPPHLHHKAVQIHLQDDRLVIAPIQAA